VTRDALVQLGVPANRLRTISFGEEAPVCQDANEGCWQKNRRAHLGQAQ
jgi:peptidoglycan-associated lipoprotein